MSNVSQLLALITVTPTKCEFSYCLAYPFVGPTNSSRSLEFSNSNSPPPHPHTHHRSYANNTCILNSAGDTYLGIGDQPGSSGKCDAANKSTIHVEVGGNTVYAPGGSVTVQCGKAISGADWLATGSDPGQSVTNLLVLLDFFVWSSFCKRPVQVCVGGGGGVW